jgi:hypothetical protein
LPKWPKTGLNEPPKAGSLRRNGALERGEPENTPIGRQALYWLQYGLSLRDFGEHGKALEHFRFNPDHILQL